MLGDPVSVVLRYLTRVKIFVIRINKWIPAFPTFFVFIDNCKQTCTFAGVDIYHLTLKHGITIIPWNWAYHGIEHPDQNTTNTSKHL